MPAVVRSAWAVLAGLLLYLSPTTRADPPAAAAEPSPILIPAAGTELFRALLEQAGIRPLSRLAVERGQLDPADDLIIVVLGGTSDQFVGRRRLVELVHDVVNHGGAALVATDLFFHLGYTRNAVGQQDWAIIESERVACADPGYIHGGREYCPYVVPLTPADRPGPDLQAPAARLFAGLSRVATNNPGYLHVRGLSGEWRQPLARFPPRSFIVNPHGDQRSFPRNTWFAVGGDGPDGTSNNTSYQFVALADHSVFINQMLVEPGTDNLELARRVVDYLQGPLRPPADKRKRCVFIENGKVIDRFDGLRQALAPPPLPAPDLSAVQGQLLDLANAVADEVQDRDLPNRWLLGAFGLPALVRFVLMAAAVWGLVYVLRRAFAARERGDRPAAPKVAAATVGPPGVFDRRYRELVQRNNLYEPVRELLRQFFVACGADATGRPDPPPVAVASAVPRPAALRSLVRQFWELAYGPPRELPILCWQEMEPDFERLKRAWGDGHWRFAPPPDVPPR